jgi:hypothetical protein
MVEQGVLSTEEILDSVKIQNKPFYVQMAARQYIKARRESNYFVASLLDNLPVMMFLMIPVFAGLLKLTYIRKKIFFIQHLIHAIHLHAFAFLIFGITLVIVYNLTDDSSIRTIFNILGFIVVAYYSFRSYRRFYDQNYFKTILKFLFTGFAYGILLFIFSVLEFIISFYLF